MRVMIVGQKWMGEQLLALCQQRGDDIAAVIAPSDDDRLAVAARQDGIHAHVTDTIRPLDIPAGLDVIVCGHAHVFIPAWARAAARYGALGYHPSLLPRHRGRDAVRWAIHMGDTVTGGTAYWMDDGADTGEIAAQDWCWIEPGETAQSLWRDKLAPIGLDLISQVLGQLDQGKRPAQAQSPIMATWEPAFTRKKLAVVR